MKQVGLKANRLLNKQEETRIGDSLKRMSNMYITLLEENRKLRKSLMKARQAPSSAPGVRPVPGRNVAGVSQIASQLSYRDILTGTIKNDQNAFKDKPVVYVSIENPTDELRKQKTEEIRRIVSSCKVEKIYPTARGVGIRCDNPSTADTVVGNLSENNIEGARKPALQPEVWIGFTPRDERDFGPIAEAVQAHPSGLQPDKWKVLRSGAKGAAVRVPLEDRDKLIRDGGLYLPGIKFRVKDSPHIRVCFDCGQPHSGPCTATTKACCNCGRNHSLRDCKNHPQLAPDQISCTLCGKKGHNSLAGVGAVAMCPRKLDLIKVKLSKTGLGPNSPSWSFLDPGIHEPPRRTFLDRYTVFQAPVVSSSGRCRACILVHRDLAQEVSLLGDFSDPDLAIIAFRDIFLASIYIDPASPSIDIMDKLGIFLDAHRVRSHDGCRLVVGLDSNAHHSAWGLMSQGSRPEGETGFTSIIDLTLATGGVEVVDWKVICGSEDFGDHRPVAYRILLPRRRPVSHAEALPSLLTGYPHHLTDWSRYKEASDALLDLSQLQHLPMTRPETAAAHLLGHIIEQLVQATKRATPYKPRRDPLSTEDPHTGSPRNSQGRRKVNPWWDKTLREKRKELNKFKRDPRASRENVIRCRGEYRALIRQKKQQASRAFLDSLDKEDKMYEAYKRVKSSLSASATPSLLAGDITPEQTCSKLADQCPNPHDSSMFLGHTPACMISEEEVINSLNAAKGNSDKMGGADGLRWRHFIEASEKLYRLVATLFSWCLAYSIVPDAWRVSLVVFIPKPGRDPTSVSSKRPISLTPVLCKWFERTLLLRASGIQRYLRDKGHQFAYLKQLSPLHAINHIVSFKRTHKRYFCLSVDVKSAFCEIAHSAIDKGLRLAGCPEDVTKWFSAWLETRTGHAFFRGSVASRQATPGVGVPQGSVAGPTLFTTAIEDALETAEIRIKERLVLTLRVNPAAVDVQIVAFADDVTVLVGFRCKVRLSAEEVQDLCQYELTRAFAYTALRMDPSKCQSLTNLRRVMLPVVSYAIEFWGPSLANVSYKRMIAGATSTELLNLAIERQLHREYSVGPRGKALERKWAQELRERAVDATAHHEILGRSTPPTEICPQVRILGKEEAIAAEQGLRNQLVRAYTDGSRKPPEETPNYVPSTEETIGSAAIIYQGNAKDLEGTIPGNDEADQCANEARLIPNSQMARDVPIPVAHTKSLLTEYIAAEKVKQKVMKYYKNGRVLNLLAGHSKILHYYVSKLKPDHDPGCRVCPGQQHDMAHVVLLCPTYADSRPEWLTGLGSVSITESRFKIFLKFLERIVETAEGNGLGLS
ncbi:hypothetical protein FOZ60_004828 [Perkinsus olseni]|uniref:Reverse transcriptase domain-containing protein n=2 Tax=Perkinsus olseni TaxID=32597 RepID=A0A7J6NSC9_PEROL|nr:hypothetical protein FOZ60_004828 [Perkinsus olseni]